MGYGWTNNLQDPERVVHTENPICIETQQVRSQAGRDIR